MFKYDALPVLTTTNFREIAASTYTKHYTCIMLETPKDNTYLYGYTYSKSMNIILSTGITIKYIILLYILHKYNII